MRALTDELGLESSGRRLDRARCNLRNGKFVSGNYAGFKAIMRARDLSWGSRLRLPRIIWELRRNRALLDFYAIGEGGTSRRRVGARLGAIQVWGGRCSTT